MTLHPEYINEHAGSVLFEEALARITINKRTARSGRPSAYVLKTQGSDPKGRRANLRRDLWKAAGAVCDLYSEEECDNYFKAAGYEVN